jgi:hypothetical protein
VVRRAERDGAQHVGLPEVDALPSAHVAQQCGECRLAHEPVVTPVDLMTVTGQSATRLANEPIANSNGLPKRRVTRQSAAGTGGCTTATLGDELFGVFTARQT